MLLADQIRDVVVLGAQHIRVVIGGPSLKSRQRNALRSNKELVAQAYTGYFCHDRIEHLNCDRRG